MRERNPLIYPLLFALVLVPVMIVALLTFRPGDDCQCDCAALPVIAHSHGAGLARTVKGDMQLIFNVSAAAQLFQLVDGNLELCGEEATGGDFKHITVDVNDARLALGERLPVTVDLTLRRADTGEIVVQAGAPAMYAPGHGYHFGDNFRVPPGATYAWEVIVSPVQALRQEGAQDLWLEPVTWEGTFTLDADGAVVDRPGAVTLIGNIYDQGIHVSLSYQAAQTLYAVDAAGGTTSPQVPAAHSRYFLVDVTDHSVNYEEKLPGADVTLTFRQGETRFDLSLPAVIGPVYGFHYGANVPLAPGTWQITVTVAGLDVLRHAGGAVTLARQPVSETFDFTLE